jgi:hypothetical protein
MQFRIKSKWSKYKKSASLSKYKIKFKANPLDAFDLTVGGGDRDFVIAAFIA